MPVYVDRYGREVQQMDKQRTTGSIDPNNPMNLVQDRMRGSSMPVANWNPNGVAEQQGQGFWDQKGQWRNYQQGNPMYNRFGQYTGMTPPQQPQPQVRPPGPVEPTMADIQTFANQPMGMGTAAAFQQMDQVQWGQMTPEQRAAYWDLLQNGNWG